MRKVIDIYREYAIPENLQMHMLRVTACSKLIVDNWHGQKLNEASLYRVLLLHDMGNIVKISGSEISDRNFQQIRKHFIEAYGYDDHAVSEAIGLELGLSEHEIYIMKNKIFILNDHIVDCQEYELKIGAYCDQRVAPESVMPLLGRLNEAKERYKDKPGSSMNNPKTDYLIQCAVKIEKQVMEYCDILPEQINDENISEYIDYFRGYEI